MWKFLTTIPVARESLLLSLQRLHTEISSKQISDHPSAASVEVEEPMEEPEGNFRSLGCPASWQQAKQAMRRISDHPEISTLPVDAANLGEAVRDARKLFPINYLETSECGLGRLSVEIGNLIAKNFQVEDFRSAETISSPVMTVILDYSWEEISDSGWPIFDLFAQWQLKSIGNFDLRDLGDELSSEFFALLIDGLTRRDMEMVYQASYAYLNLTGGNSDHVPMASLCAVTALAMDDRRILQNVQTSLRESLRTVDDLIFTFQSPWPLWPLLSLSTR